MPILRVLGVLFSEGTNNTAGTIVAFAYANGVDRVHNFKALDETCEFFNDCNALDNCSPTGPTTLTTTEIDTITTTSFSEVIQTQTITENETTAAAVIIIPEQNLQKHSKHDVSYHNKDDDSKEEEDDCEE